MTPKIRRSTGNVFADLGFPLEEAEHLRARAAKLFGVSQPRISDLTRGKIDRFSIDTLVETLGHAGAHVSLKVQRRRHVA